MSLVLSEIRVKPRPHRHKPRKVDRRRHSGTMKGERTRLKFSDGMMIPSSRTPEGQPHRCPVCHQEVRVEPSFPPGDAPCPNCGHLLWFEAPSREHDADQLRWQIERLAKSIEASQPAGGGRRVGVLSPQPCRGGRIVNRVGDPQGRRSPTHLASTLGGIAIVAAIIGFICTTEGAWHSSYHVRPRHGTLPAAHFGGCLAGSRQTQEERRSVRCNA